jgi:hypothetical protein
MVRALIVMAVFSAVAVGADQSYQSAKYKIDLIEEDRAAPGSRIWLSVAELNAYARIEAARVVPQGLRNPRLELGQGSATGSALVDFLQVRGLDGPSPSRLIAWFLAGERPVRVTASIESGRRRATVNVQQVTLSGMTAQGAVLDFLIANFLLPFYPQAKIGQPFDLKHGVERLEVTPAGVRVFMAAKSPTR